MSSVIPARRRLYVMRHAQVRYFQGVHPEQVVLTDEGRRQAEAAAEELSAIRFDRVVTSGLARTLETARIVARGAEPEHRYELREIESGDIRGLDPAEVQELMTTAFRGVVPLDARFLGGFEQAPGCVNILDVDAEGRFVVRAVNHTPYDPAHVQAPRATTMEQLWEEYLAAREERRLVRRAGDP